MRPLHAPDHHWETISSIARVFGVSRRTIDKDIERSLQMLDETNRKAINEIVPQALENAKLIMAEAWKGWERNCLDASSTTETQKSGGDGGPSTIVSRTTARQAGDPRFLAEMRQAMSFLVDIEKRKKAAEENAPPKPPLLIGVVVDSAEQRDQVLSFAEFQERAKLPEG